MGKSNSVKLNFIYNLSLNMINVIFPLIMIPYVFQKLGATNFGKYNFAMSFSQWFLVFAAFGTAVYGVREIAKNRGNQKKLDSTFTEIFILNFIATISSFILFLIFISLSPKINSEMELFLVVALSILMNIFSIDWLYMGLENFKIITIRTLIIKFICLIGILLFINGQEDYVIYALIMVLAVGLSNIINFIYSYKFVNLRFKRLQLKNHLKPLLIFFFSSLVVSIYTIFDVILLGFFSTHVDVAYYSISKQIYSIALTITLSISMVLSPKLTYLAKHDFEAYKTMLKKSIDYIYLLSIPAMVGLVILSKDILWLIGGEELQVASISLITLAILVFIVSLGTWQYNQLIVPLGYEKVGLKIQLLMALISLLFNILLVPKYGYFGASVSLVIAEASGIIIGVIYGKIIISSVRFKYITNSLPKYVLSSLIMAISVLSFKFLYLGSIINLVVGVIIGPIVYLGILYFLNENICRQYIKVILNKIGFKNNKVKKELN